MTKSLLVVLSLAVVAGASWAITPEQAGTYTGTIKSKVYTPSGKTTTKLPMELSLAADNSTTLTIDGVVQWSDVDAEPVDGVLFFESNTTSSFSMLSLHFKKTSLKGTGSGFVEGPPLSVLESKISLKKSAP